MGKNREDIEREWQEALRWPKLTVPEEAAGDEVVPESRQAAGAQRSNQPAGVQTPVQPAGTQRPAQPTGTQTPAQPAGAQRPGQPKGDQRPNQEAGQQTSRQQISGKENDENLQNEASDRIRRRQLQREKRRKKRRIVSVFLVLLLLCISGAFLAKRYLPTRKKISERDYFNAMITRAQREAGWEEEAPLGEDESAVMLQDHVDPRAARILDGGLYLQYDMVRENIFTRFYWDEENSQMLYTTADAVMEISPGSAEYTCGEETLTFDRPVILKDDRGLYLSADFLARYDDVEWVLPEDGCHVLVNYDWSGRTAVTAKKDMAVRYEPNIKGLIVTRTQKGDTLFVLNDLDQWLRVMTGDGYIGYVPAKRATEPETISFTRDFEAPVYPDQVRDEKINLIWHQIDIAEANNYLMQDTKDMEGVNVISPTWFAMTDNEGNISSFGDLVYVNRAHKMGLEVWGLVSNFSADVSTTVTLSSTRTRRNLIANLISEAQKLHLDGINVDLEAITKDGAYSYVQFVRELSVECRKLGLVLSVDLPVPMDFNQYYDREELGVFADYLIIMGYDEHYYGSEAGSVGSLPFEENGIVNTLKTVPARKIISGVPFYTRLWYTAGESVWSEIWGMNAISRTLETYSVTPDWDDETGQYYAAWYLEDGTLCQVWVEDESSIAVKAALVPKYDVGGIAAWRLGDERKTIWKVISENAFPDHDE